MQRRRHPTSRGCWNGAGSLRSRFRRLFVLVRSILLLARIRCTTIPINRSQWRVSRPSSRSHSALTLVKVVNQVGHHALRFPGECSNVLAVRPYYSQTSLWRSIRVVRVSIADVFHRDWPSVFRAAQAARDGCDDEAEQYLKASDAEIQQVVSLHQYSTRGNAISSYIGPYMEYTHALRLDMR